MTDSDRPFEIQRTTIDGESLEYRSWPREDPRGRLVIVHGMGDHSGRYAESAEAFAERAGLTVQAPELPGHGEAVRRGEPPGDLGQDGFERTASRLAGFLGEPHRTSRELPIFLLGHSLGSYFALRAAQLTEARLSGLILTGTSGRYSAPLLVAGRALFGLLGLVNPTGGRSKALRRAIDHRIAARFPGEPASAWQTRDPNEQAEFEADERCGHELSVRSWSDLLRSLPAVHDPRLLPAGLSICIASGTDDVLADLGSGVESFARDLRAADHDVTLHRIDGARHEVLHETDRAETRLLIEAWMEERSHV